MMLKLMPSGAAYVDDRGDWYCRECLQPIMWRDDQKQDEETFTWSITGVCACPDDAPPASPERPQ